MTEEVSHQCLRPIRGCATDDQYCDALERVKIALAASRAATIEECAKVVESQHYLSDGYEIWAALEKAAVKLRAVK